MTDTPEKRISVEWTFGIFVAFVAGAVILTLMGLRIVHNAMHIPDRVIDANENLCLGQLVLNTVAGFLYALFLPYKLPSTTVCKAPRYEEFELPAERIIWGGAILNTTLTVYWLLLIFLGLPLFQSLVGGPNTRNEPFSSAPNPGLESLVMGPLICIAGSALAGLFGAAIAYGLRRSLRHLRSIPDT